jgi:small-conductance mechanosensitive channel
MFENHLGLIVIVFAVAIVAFTFRHTIAYDLQLTKRERNKFTEKTILIPLFIVIVTAGYLYIKQDFFLLSIIISVILAYFLYLVGILDMIIEPSD